MDELPIRIRTHNCANGETKEYRLLVGDEIVAVLWGTNQSHRTVLQRLLRKVLDQ